mgnify:CR=1 FL=1
MKSLDRLDSTGMPFPNAFFWVNNRGRKDKLLTSKIVF